MGLAAVFKVSIYTLTGFVGLALGLAEQGPIPYLSLPITLFAYWWCEGGMRRKGFSLGGMNETTASAMGVVALGAATIEFFGNNPEGKLLAGIHLVVYLTWVVLLQKKSVYRYWLMLALGIMHVAVGSVLTNSTWYGLCMVIYLFGAIWTLSVFSLYRVAREFSLIEPGQPALPGPGTGVSPGPGSDGAPWVLNGVRLEDDSEWISMRLVSGVTMTSLSGLLVGIAFFILVPRIWVGSALGIADDALPPALRRNITGQMTEVQLGDMGPILASNDPVLTIRLFDNQTNQPIDAQTYAEWLGLREPLFRGAVLTQYSEGRWRPERAWGSAAPFPTLPRDIRLPVPIVRQEIRLERLGNRVLPCIGRVLAMHDPNEDRCGLIQSDGLVIRRIWFEEISGPVNYMAYTELPTADRRQDPGLIASSNELLMNRVSRYLERCTRVPDDLQRVRDLAVGLVDDESRKAGSPLTDLEKARIIESYLRDSGLFTYSLDAAAVNSSIDPVEDFLLNGRAGHCQYFASALGLMLRSIGIPARLVAGFKGGEVLENGALNVEKRYAHVWVEAWIDGRKWMTFDATPEDQRAESVTAIGTRRNFLTTLISQLGGIWESNVLEVSYERQEGKIYQPLREAAGAVVAAFTQFWRSPRSSLLSILAFLVDPRNWLTWRGVLALATLLGLLWLLRRKSAWFKRLWPRKPVEAAASARQRVEFYERFVRLMQSHGRTREIAQTQGEFVHQVADDLAGQWTDPSLGDNLQSVGDLFYRVRFGAGPLTPQEVGQMDDLLTRLERDLDARRDHRPQPVSQDGTFRSSSDRLAETRGS